MKKILICIILAFSISSNAQILKVKQNIQLQDQWCWAACSQTLMNYYNDSSSASSQCEIADYARTKIKWRSFGSDPCCLNPSGPCNYWNYMWGDSGSLNGILNYYLKLKTSLVYSDISKSVAESQFIESKPFIFRWGWTNGGGHFLVGHGVNNSSLYYMNPWFGEGLKIADYDWVVSNADHTWTHTILIQTISQQNNMATPNLESIKVYPNPSVGALNIQNINNNSGYSIEIYNSYGSLMMKTEVKPHIKLENLNISDFYRGVYLVKLIQDGISRTEKILITD